jgi:hypothetical protein
MWVQAITFTPSATDMRVQMAAVRAGRVRKPLTYNMLIMPEAQG